MSYFTVSDDIGARDEVPVTLDDSKRSQNPFELSDPFASYRTALFAGSNNGSFLSF